MSSTPPIFDGLEKVPIHDADGNHAYDALPPEARGLVEEGLGRLFGSRRRPIGVVLLCDLDKVKPGHAQRAMSAESYGKRYVFEEHVGDRFYVYAYSDFDEAGRNCLLNPLDFLEVVGSVGGRLLWIRTRRRRRHHDPPTQRHGHRRLVPPCMAAPRGPATPER